MTGRAEGTVGSWETDAVVLAGEAWTTAKWIKELEPELSAALDAIHYCRLVVVGLGIRREDIEIPPGFGFLANRDQGLRILGAIFNSNFLPDRAPEGCAALTVMVGGDLDPSAANLDDAERNPSRGLSNFVVRPLVSSCPGLMQSKLPVRPIRIQVPWVQATRRD